ncbi:molybdopterin-dependent oxidoreductase [Streptomyces sp. NPDC002055]|uniref:molybdopterin-dependent oxidoreductase n=1 Tax=Streptomyces sp. NPDC002055 TaxID=3154534 RepID=UPI00332EED7F
MRDVLGALSGLLAAFAALAVAELVSAAVRPEAGPVTVVGGVVIDSTPTAVKSWAIRTFGAQDKLVLQLGILTLLALFAVVLGLLALRFRRSGSAGVLAFGLLGAAAALQRPAAQPLDVVPALAGAVAGAGVLYLLAGRLAARTVPGAGTAEGPGRSGGADADGSDSSDGSHGSGSSEGSGGPDASGGPGGPDASEAPEGAEGAEGRERTEGRQSTKGREGGEATGVFDRRGFVVAASVAAAASAGAGLLGRRLNASGARAAASRKAVALPAPASPAAPVPRGAGLGLRGLSSHLTPTKDFYRVDTALVVPKVDAESWRLRIHGKGVTRPLTLDFQDLLRRALIERRITLTCVSNEVGGPYAGNAQWIGVRLADLLREAGVRPPSRGGPADQLVARSVDGMTLGSPVETVMDGRDAMLAVGMNGEPLPFAHGFPVRMVVPGLYGYVSACKWLQDLELTTFADYDPYWVKRNWAREAPVKTQSRIDTPRPLADLRPGTVRVAGVAWAQHRGIDRVEVRVDGGAWHRARLAAEDTEDTWRQWMWEWQATSGSHTLEVRATDRGGRPQTGERVGTVPDGATGWHALVVNVA